MKRPVLRSFCILSLLILNALSSPAVLLSVDAGTNHWKTISRRIYGINIANWCQHYYLKLCTPMLTNAHVAVVRYGATNIERYNWRNNRMYNVISMTNQYVPTSWESFVDWVRNDLGADPFLQVSVFSHVAADDGVTDYAHNYSVDQSPTDVTAWVVAAGTNVPIWGVGNEPFIAWKLHEYDGERDSNAESYAYNDGAHGDQIFNEDIARERYFPQYLRVAQAVRSGNPSAKILGPTPANWWLYWSTDYSPFCPATRADPGAHEGENGWFTMAAAANQWDPRVFPDRDGDPGVVGWEQNEKTGVFNESRNMCQFAKRIADYAASHGGTQVCDYLDFHRYMNLDNDAGAVQETRGLWDPDYQSYDKETGGSGTKTKLLTRFQGIIDHYNTNMMMSLSEYDFFYWQGHPAEQQVSALGEIDFLGTFAKKGVQLACNWYIGEPDQSGGGYHHAADSAKQAMFNEKGEGNPKYWAFKLMSDNFRDKAVETASSEKDAFSVYAGLNTSCSQLLVVAHFKGIYTPWWDTNAPGAFIEGQGNSNATIVVSNFTIRGVKSVQRFGRYDPYIVPMATGGVTVAGNSFTYDFEPLSIYLFTFHGSNTPPAETVPDTCLHVNPARIDFGPYETGIDASSNYTHCIKISNARNSNTTWSVSESLGWLAIVGPTSGVATVTDRVFLKLTNKSAYAVGVYSGNVTVATSEGTKLVPVTMEVIPGEAQGELRVFDAETGSLAHNWTVTEPYQIGFYDIHGSLEDRNDPYIYVFSMDYAEKSALGGLASLRVDFDRSAGDTSGGRLYAMFGTYGHGVSNAPTYCWVPTNASPSNYVFKFDIKTKTEGVGFTKTEFSLVITDDLGHKGKPNVLISDYKGSIEINDGTWQTISIPLGTNFFDWRYPEGQDGSTTPMDFSKVRQVEFCPWVGHEDKKGTLWLDNLRIETVNAQTNHYPIAVASQDRQLIGTNETVQFTGTNSYDPDGTIASYAWSPTSGLSSANVANPVFTPPSAGTYVFELVVTDNHGLKSRNPAQAVVYCQPTLFPASLQLYRNEAMTDEIIGTATNCLDVFVKLTCFAGGFSNQTDFTLARVGSNDSYGPDANNNVNAIDVALQETGPDTKIFTGRFRLAAFSDEQAGEVGVSEGCTLSVSNNGYRITRTVGRQWYGRQIVVDHIEDGTDKFNALDGIWCTYDDRPNGNSSVVSMASSALAANSNSTQSIRCDSTLHLVTSTNFNQLFAGLQCKLTPYTNDIPAAVMDLSSTTGIRGISFWLRGNGTKVSIVLKSLAITNYDDYLYTIDHAPTNGWRQYQLLFSDFSQEGWGNRAVERDTALRLANSIQFKFASKSDGQTNQLFVDDLALFGGSRWYLPHAVYQKKNTLSMEGFDGAFVTNRTFATNAPGWATNNAPGWTLTGNARNEAWGDGQLAFENWAGTTDGSAYQIVPIQSNKAYQLTALAQKGTGFNGNAYVELNWLDSSSNSLGTDSTNITIGLTTSLATFTLPWRWAPANAAFVRVQLRTTGGVAPPWSANVVQFDEVNFSEYGYVSDNGWISGWIGGESIAWSTNRAEGRKAMQMHSTNANWLSGMFVAPYGTGETRTNFSGVDGLAIKACRPAAFTNTGRVPGRFRIVVATNADPVASTRWYPVGASAWEDYILFPKARFYTADSVDSNDPSAWIVWSNAWTDVRRVVVELGPSRETNAPYDVIVDDFRPYANSYVPDDIVDDPITNSSATTNALSIYTDAGIPTPTVYQVVSNSTDFSWDPNYAGETPPEGSKCLRIQGSGSDALSIAFTQSCRTVASLDTPGQAWNVTLNGNYAYVADADQGMRIVDVSNPLAPSNAASVLLPMYARDIDVRSNYAYVASLPFKIYNVSNPTNPVEVGSINVGNAFAVELAGNYAYIVRRDGTRSLAIVNVSNPSNPVLTGTANIGSVDCHVRVSNNYAYVALQDTGFHVIDVSTPSAPVILTTNAFFYTQGVDLKGGYAFVGSYGALRVMNITTPTSPQLVATLPYTGYSRDVRIQGNYAYVPGDCGLRIIDISTPTNPVMIGCSDTMRDEMYGVDVTNGYAFVASYTNGLKVLDVSKVGGSSNLAAYVDGFLKFYVKTPVDLQIALNAGGSVDTSASLQQYGWSGSNAWQEVRVPLRGMGCTPQKLQNVFELFKCAPNSPTAATFYIDNVRLSNQY